MGAAKITHTPGPWVIGDESSALMACPEGGTFHAIDAPAYGHFALAVVVTQLSKDYPSGSTCAELMGNARLIAAAPDLLAALEAALAVIADYLEYEHNGDPWTEDARAMGEMDIDDYRLDGRFEAARALIAKATGATNG